MAKRRDVIEILTRDHREVEQVFAELESLRGKTSDAERGRRGELMQQVTTELVRHAVAEETEVYPVINEKVSEDEAERAKHEHAEAEETLKRLEGLQPDDPSVDAELATVMREIRAHIAEEEGEMFVHLRQVLSEEELVELGAKVEAVKKLAPTRPHPSVPNEPGLRKAIGPLAGLVDRVRDATRTLDAPNPRVVAEKARQVAAKVRPGSAEGRRSLPIRRNSDDIRVRWEEPQLRAAILDGIPVQSPSRPIGDEHGDWRTTVTIALEMSAPVPGTATHVPAGKALRRLKALCETGEIPSTDFNPSARSDVGEAAS